MFMKRIVVLFFVCATAILLVLNFSCAKVGSAGYNNGGTKDSILVNIGANIIIPSYQALATNVNSLDSAITDFNLAPNSTKLSTVQTLFTNAYISWQAVSQYNYFGPASDAIPALTSLNIFPTTTAIIDTNISRNNDNVNTFANTTAKGFPALDYLLFGTNNTTLLADYTTDAKATNRQTYLAAVSADIKTEVNAVLNQWLPGGGNYINTFETGTGNSISSSLGLLVNSIDQDFEITKNDRLGIPLAKIPVGTVSPILPNEVEAYYSGISVQLAVAEAKAVQGIYLGNSANGNGLGLKTYLVNAEQQKNLKYNGGILSDTISLALTSTISNMQAIPDPLSATIQANPANADAVFAECQGLTALLKTDLPSDLMVSINYGDTDGD